MERPDIFLDSVCLDCTWDQVPEMIRFYAALLGFEKDDYDEEAMPAVFGKHFSLSFQPVNGYQAPTWPNEIRGQQIHLDLIVKDLHKAVAYARSIGAKDAPAQYGDTWFVMLDPAGHPFCLTLNGDPGKHPWRE